MSSAREFVPGDRPPLGLRLTVIFVLLYRSTLGRLLGGQCRYHPTCSEYAIDAVRKHGLIRGWARSIRRIGRCHPFSKGGYDPA